ncbi:ABC transporter substrate-binding protein [Marinilabiliaceae bacterium JC017]|nr:ABC transporter substrate-binding protein [Marinilabiliaceae bacterium JC017]
MKKFSTTVLLIALMCSCTLSPDSKTKKIEFTDSFDQHIVLEKAPARIVSCAPLITEIIYALGEEKRLCGRTDYCVYPPQAAAVSSIGGLMDPCLECIVKLEPDLVLASTHFKKSVADKLGQLNYPVAVMMSQQSIAGAEELISKIGQVLGVTVKADSVITHMQQERQRIIAKLPVDAPHPSVYYVVGFGKQGDYTAGGDTFIHELITLAGGKNVAADVKGWGYSLEALMDKDPDVIIIKNPMKQAFCETEPYNQLSAVKNNRVYEIDNHLIEINGPHIMEGLEQLVDIFHP